ncbi:MAG TPA: hypothetical protein VFI96_03085 [Longimicrobiaceae bacterium]|nr:hypothetical protein [Longimicrobiaceae bacterium]
MHWDALVSPMHRFFGGLWIGTLFVLVVAGLAMVLRDDPSREERGVLAADMMNAFSPMALMAGALLVATVFALGAWNWKRQRPTLGTGEAAASLRRSARAELAVAAPCRPPHGCYH